MAGDPVTGETLNLATQRHLVESREISGQSDSPSPAGHPATTDPQPPSVTATADALGISEEYLLDNLQTIISEAMSGTPVYDKDGTYAGQVPQLQTALRAIETAMKHRGMLAEKHETAVTGGITISIVGVNPDQLR